MHVLDVTTGTELPSAMDDVTPDNMVGKLHPAGLSLYAMHTDRSPRDMFRFALDGAEVGEPVESKYHGDYDMCGDLWISADGERILTGCGTAFRAAPGADSDMDYQGRLEEVHPGLRNVYDPWYRSLAEDPGGGRIFGLPQLLRFRGPPRLPQNMIV